MRLLIHSPEFPPGPGGIGTHAFHIARQLCHLGHEVVVITPQDYVDPAIEEEFNQRQPFQILRLEHVEPPLLEALQRLRVLGRKIRAWKPDLMLATGDKAAWIVCLLAGMSGVPWMAVGHGTEFGGGLTLKNRITRWAFNRADGVVCVSNYTRQVMYALGIKPKTEQVIHNGADADLFRPGERSGALPLFTRLGIPEQAFVLLTVGHVSSRKGQEVVVRAMPEILAHCPEVHYVMAGLPTGREYLENVGNSLGVRAHIHFAGRLHEYEILSLYQACDLFLMTSRHVGGDFEGFGIAVIEAALCGKTSVVSVGSGLEEAVVHGVTGICVPENDHHQTAAAVIGLIADPAKRQQMAERAYLRARQEFTWGVAGRKYNQFMQGILRYHR